MQIRPPHFPYALASHSFSPILTAAQGGFLLQLSAMSKTHARFRAIQAASTTYPTEACRCPKSSAAYAPAKTCARLEVALTVAKEIDVVARGRGAEARMLKALGLLLELRLLVHRLREMRERVGEVVAGESAPVRRHRMGLSPASVCLLQSRWRVAHPGRREEASAVAGRGGEEISCSPGGTLLNSTREEC